MESQDSLIHSITNADEDDPRNDTIESVVPPAKSRFLILEPAILLLFFAWSVAGIKIAAIVLHNVRSRVLFLRSKAQYFKIKSFIKHARIFSNSIRLNVLNWEHKMLQMKQK